MNDILASICATKRQHVAARRAVVSEAVIRERISVLPKTRGFEAALRALVSKQKNALIAEVKKASPSKGVIREDFDPIAIARAYQQGGASCISVLTDQPYFQGEDRYLEQVREVTTLPLLRKDFMLEPYQIYESRVLGADAILLIMAALSDDQAAELFSAARACGLDVLVEVHDEEELTRALKLPGTLIGVNHRNLKTMTIDLSLSERLVKQVPQTHLLVAESGIHTPADIARFNKVGIHSFLVGESLMREQDVERATRVLLGNT